MTVVGRKQAMFECPLS